MAGLENRPLGGLRVVEIASSVPAAACGRQFARWGAQVVKVAEATTQDRDVPLTPDGLMWESLDSNKQVHVGEVTDAMVADADVLVTDQTREQLPVDLPSSAWPMVVDISPYGRRGEYAGHAGNVFTAEAMSGFMSVQGERDKAPLRMPGDILGKACGISAFVAALAGVHRYRETGVKEQIEVSCMQLLSTIVPTLRTQLDKPEQRDGGPGTDPLGVRLYQFADSYLSFNFAMKPALNSLLDIIGLDDSHIPEALLTFADRQDYQRLKQFVEELPSPFDAHDLFTIISEPPHSSAVGKVLTPLETIEDRQLSVLGFWQAHDHPKLGRLLRSGPPARLSRTPAEPTTAAEPFLAWAAPERRRPGCTPAEQPLAGIRIVDLTQAWIGPYASQVLSDLGADVIKVESLAKPDVWRNLPPKKPPGMKNPDALLVNSSCNFNSVNRDKKSLVLDLASEKGRSLLLDLVGSADIVMENYRPNVMPRLGLGYDALNSVKPDLIMVSFSAYGETGPYSEYRGNGTTIEALSGWDSLFGYADGPPLVMGFYQADALTGLQMAASTLVALAHRDQTGEGQHVQGSMFEAAVDYIEEYVLLQQLTGEVPRHGNRSSKCAPQGVYKCRGEDNWVAISTQSDVQWQALCALIDGLDPRMSLAARRATHDEIDHAISAWARDRSAEAVTAALQSEGVAVAPVQTTDQLLNDPHLASIDWWHHLDHPDLGAHQYAGFPYRFSDNRLRSEHPSPRLGQHSRMLLKSELSLDDQEIDALFEAGISGEQW